AARLEVPVAEWSWACSLVICISLIVILRSLFKGDGHGGKKYKRYKGEADRRRDSRVQGAWLCRYGYQPDRGPCRVRAADLLSPLQGQAGGLPRRLPALGG